SEPLAVEADNFIKLVGGARDAHVPYRQHRRPGPGDHRGPHLRWLWSVAWASQTAGRLGPPSRAGHRSEKGMNRLSPCGRRVLPAGLPDGMLPGSPGLDLAAGCGTVALARVRGWAAG